MELTDPTHRTSEPTRYWSSANVGEATPDVLSPMCWSFWGPRMEAGARRAYHDLGILDRHELEPPDDPNQLLTAHFYGRPAMNLDRLRSLFDAVPGMTADDFERDICGELRPDLPPEPSRNRLPFILAKAPVAMATTGTKVRRLHAEQLAWWQRDVLDGPAPGEPLAHLVQAADRFEHAFHLHVRERLVLMSVQAQLTALAAGVGRPDLVLQLLAGLGGVAETQVADDLWLVSRRQLELAAFVRRHGYHGPNEGNLTSHSWREDPGPVERLVDALAARPDSERPRAREAVAVAARQRAITDLLAALPAPKRPVARWLCRVATRAVQANELGKASYLMAIDGGRAATRALGRDLVAGGLVDDADDAFFFTIDELVSGLPANAREVVAFRRTCREDHRAKELPLTFTGPPEPLPAGVATGAGSDQVHGLGGSAGLVEGRARVVLDPATAEPLEEGEVLVCRFTDPSWAPLFLFAAALVIDIGASASHGAIVARELGIPCVIGTGDGTRRIATGDLVRVDGSAGLVTIVEPAGTRGTRRMTLHDHDEGFHAPPAGVDRWQENLFFLLWDTSTRNGFVVHLQRVPGLGWQEAQAMVSIGGRLASATLRRAFRRGAGVPELTLEPEVAWRRWRLRGGFGAAEGHGPLGFVFADPAATVEAELDVTLQAGLEPIDFGAGLRQVVDAMERDRSGPQMTHAEHYEQGGTWYGRLRIGSEEVEAAGLFVRDHSWGPRHEQNAFQAFWTATCLDEGRWFGNAIGIVQRDRVAGIGAVVDEQGVRFTTEVTATYLPSPGLASYERATVRYGAGVDVELSATTQLHVPMYLPHSGPRRYDNNALSAVRLGERTGFGVMEWLDVLAPSQADALEPSGLASDALAP